MCPWDGDEVKGAEAVTAASLCPEGLVPFGDLCPPGCSAPQQSGFFVNTEP